MTVKTESIALSQISIPSNFENHRPELFGSDRSVKQAVKDLAESIKQNGLLQPIVVRKSSGKAEKPYVLVFGLRRLKAHELLSAEGEKACSSIDAMVLPMNDEKAITYTFEENDKRRAVTYAALCDSVDQLVQKGLSASAAGKALNIPGSTARFASNLWKKAEECVKIALAKGEVTREEAEGLSEKAAEDQEPALKALLAAKVEANKEGGSRRQKSEKRREAADLPPKEGKMSLKDLLTTAQTLEDVYSGGEGMENVAAQRVLTAIGAFRTAAGRMTVPNFIREFLPELAADAAVQMKKAKAEKPAKAAKPSKADKPAKVEKPAKAAPKKAASVKKNPFAGTPPKTVEA